MKDNDEISNNDNTKVKIDSAVNQAETVFEETLRAQELDSDQELDLDEESIGENEEANAELRVALDAAGKSFAGLDADSSESEDETEELANVEGSDISHYAKSSEDETGEVLIAGESSKEEEEKVEIEEEIDDTQNVIPDLEELRVVLEGESFVEDTLMDNDRLIATPDDGNNQENETRFDKFKNTLSAAGGALIVKFQEASNYIKEKFIQAKDSTKGQKTLEVAGNVLKFAKNRIKNIRENPKKSLIAAGLLVAGIAIFGGTPALLAVASVVVPAALTIGAVYYTAKHVKNQFSTSESNATNTTEEQNNTQNTSSELSQQTAAINAQTAALSANTAAINGANKLALLGVTPPVQGRQNSRPVTDTTVNRRKLTRSNSTPNLGGRV